MNKIKCLGCSTELESKHRHDFVRCKCPNGSFTDGGNDYMRIGAKDITKIRIWNEKEQKWKKLNGVQNE